MSFTRGMPFVPGQVRTFELACNDLWTSLKKLSVPQLKALHPTGPYKPLIDALIDVRSMMDGGVPECNRLHSVTRSLP